MSGHGRPSPHPGVITAGSRRNGGTSSSRCWPWPGTRWCRPARRRASSTSRWSRTWAPRQAPVPTTCASTCMRLPQIPHRLGEELGGAARYMIKERVCPWCRLVRDEVAKRDRLVYADATTVCFAPWPSRSPFELWVVPRHHEADFGRATDDQIGGRRGRAPGCAAQADVLDGPPYNLVLHTAPVKERVDETYHWHWESTPGCARRGLEAGHGPAGQPGEPRGRRRELLGEPGGAASGTPAGSGSASGAGSASDGPRSWDAFPRG